VPVRGAILANKNSSIKLFYRKISKKGVSPQKAQIAAARKMACTVWKVLNSKQPYTEQDDHMTKRKMKIMSSKAMRIIPTSVMPSKEQYQLSHQQHHQPSRQSSPQIPSDSEIERITKQKLHPHHGDEIDVDITPSSHDTGTIDITDNSRMMLWQLTRLNYFITIASLANLGS
jgi:hypothetical protein